MLAIIRSQARTIQVLRLIRAGAELRVASYFNSSFQGTVAAQEHNHPVGRSSFAGLRNCSVANFIRSAVSQSRYQPAAPLLRDPLRGSLSAVCGADVRISTQSAEVICRAPPGRTGIEIPHPHGLSRTAVIHSAGHRHVLVRLRLDESLDR